MAKGKDNGGASGAGPSGRTVTVSASAAVSAAPDVAFVSARAISEAQTAAEALTRNNAVMEAVVAGLGKLGIASRDVRTASFQVEPRYAGRSQSAAPPEIAGYRVANQLELAVRNVERLGDVLDQLVRLGINQMDSLSFDVSEPDKLMDEARGKAIATALQRAKLLAAAAGAEVGDVLTIIEASGSSGGPAPRKALMESVPIAAGSTTLSVQVTVTWALT